MPLPLYLAMTSPELSTITDYPEHLAYMACHFSSSSRALSNLPVDLPKGTVIIVNDSTPPEDHDPDLICKQLTQAVEAFGCNGILLDFQRPVNMQTQTVAKAISQKLPCPVFVSEKYASGIDGPVFLSAPPANRSLKKWLAPWAGREIWLEAAPDARKITITPSGSRSVLTDPLPSGMLPHHCPQLHCHYKIEVSPKQVQFTLQHTDNDFIELLEEAQQLGVSAAVGLYQELAVEISR